MTVEHQTLSIELFTSRYKLLTFDLPHILHILVKYTCDGLTLTFNAYEAAGKLKVVYAASKYTSCGSNTDASANPKVVFTVPAGGATAAAPATGTISGSADDIAACGYTGDTVRKMLLFGK